MILGNEGKTLESIRVKNTVLALCHQGSFPKAPFSNMSPRRENDSFYFAEQTGGKQHMSSLTELQNQN